MSRFNNRMATAMSIRPARTDEQETLESLQRRASLSNPGGPDALLVNPNGDRRAARTVVRAPTCPWLVGIHRRTTRTEPHNHGASFTSLGQPPLVHPTACISVVPGDAAPVGACAAWSGSGSPLIQALV